MGFSRIRPRRGTLYEWTAVNPVLSEGEIVIECPDDGVGTGLSKFKIGDGVNTYTVLPYAFDGQAASTIIGGSATESTANVISLRADAYTAWVTINPVLAANEIVYDQTNNAIKIGDGTTAWSSLSYIKASEEVSGEYDFGNEDSAETTSSSLYSEAIDNSAYQKTASASLSDLASTKATTKKSTKSKK